MADVSPVPFINFGLSQQQQAQAGAAANLENQQAGLASQQAQQAQMSTELLRQSMPIYRQTIANMAAAMTSNGQMNSSHPTGYEPAGEQAAAADQSGTQPPSMAPPAASTPGAPPGASGGTPLFANPGAIAEVARQQNYVQPFTPGDQQRILGGSAMAALPGAAANPGLLKWAQQLQQMRVKNQTTQNQYRSGQLYDALTAVQDPSNSNPLGALAAVPGQQQIAAQIKAAYPGNVQAQQDAARRYAQMYAYNLHQYTGRGQKMENGVLVDTTVGAPVTGQEQVLTGLTPEQRSKAMQYALEPIKVTLTTGDTMMMPRDKAPVDQGGLGMSAEAYVARQNAIALRHMNDPTQPEAGTGTWNAPTAVGNTTGAQAAAQGNASGAALAQPHPSGAAPATGPALGAARTTSTVQQTADQVPSPSPQTALRGPVPPTGTPAYNARLSAALADPTYKARWNIQATPGAPLPGAKEGVTQYQTQRNDLMKRAGEVAQAADQAEQNFRAAQMILRSNAPLTGPLGALEQKIAAALNLDWRSPNARQEVAKYLTQGAVSNLKTTYGSTPGVFDVKINVEQAFPNVDTMAPSALPNLIDSQIKQAQYLKDSAVRAQVYAQKGLEPNAFPTWNSTYFPRSELLDTTYDAPPHGAEVRSYQGYQYYLKPGTDRSKRENWVKYKKVSNG